MSILTHHESIVGERGIDFGLFRQVVFQDLDVLDEAERLEHIGLVSSLINNRLL